MKLTLIYKNNSVNIEFSSMHYENDIIKITFNFNSVHYDNAKFLENYLDANRIKYTIEEPDNAKSFFVNSNLLKTIFNYTEEISSSNKDNLQSAIYDRQIKIKSIKDEIESSSKLLNQAENGIKHIKDNLNKVNSTFEKDLLESKLKGLEYTSNSLKSQLNILKAYLTNTRIKLPCVNEIKIEYPFNVFAKYDQYYILSIVRAYLNIKAKLTSKEESILSKVARINGYLLESIAEEVLKVLDEDAKLVERAKKWFNSFDEDEKKEIEKNIKSEVEYYCE